MGIQTLVTMHLRVAIAGAFLATAGAFSLSPMDGARAPMLRTNRAISRPLRVAPLSMNVDAFLEKLDSKTPQECHDLCTKEGYVYLDVRTNEENAAGTPAGAVNVPSHAKTDDGMLPMSSTFLKLVAINFPDKDVKLVVGCQAGNRSKSACFWLDEAGYKNVVENGTGYAGWSGAGLPTE